MKRTIQKIIHFHYAKNVNINISIFLSNIAVLFVYFQNRAMDRMENIKFSTIPADEMHVLLGKL